MKICVINASTKLKKSNMKVILHYLCGLLGSEEILEFNIADMVKESSLALNLKGCDAVVWGFPIYFQGVPMHVIEYMQYLGKNVNLDSKILNYFVLLNGCNKDVAYIFEQLRVQCREVGFQWGQGLVIGVCEMLPFLNMVSLGQGSLKSIGRSLLSFSDHILGHEEGGDLCVYPEWPKLLCRLRCAIFEFSYTMYSKVNRK